MPLLPLDLPPGVYRNGTDIEASGRWRDASLVRWTDGTMRPIGGWTQVSATTLPAAPRGTLAWVDNSGDRWVGIGTYEKLYAMSAGWVVSDITPVGITTGTEDSTVNTGYGGGLYGQETYGSTRTESSAISDATSWSLDTWGQNLVACSDADGKMYEWTLNTGTPAAAISNAPTGCCGLVVTPERFLFALCAGGDRRKVQWSDREDNTTWTAAATNEAGDFILQTSGRILQGIRTRGQTVILTDSDAHTATYVGPPFVYGFERVGTGCGAISRHAAAHSEGAVYWMGQGNFWMYAGGRVEEIQCDVADYVFSNLTAGQKSKVYAVANEEHSEVWWFYPQGVECDSYVVYNYKEGHWTIGSLSRSSAVDRGVFANPIWFAPTGEIYVHENGYNHNGDSAYAESGPIMAGAGDNVLAATYLYPDEKTQGQVTATFKTRFYANDTEYTHGPYTMSSPTSVRFTGRQFRMRVTGADVVDWRVGVPRVKITAMGER